MTEAAQVGDDAATADDHAATVDDVAATADHHAAKADDHATADDRANRPHRDVETGRNGFYRWGPPVLLGLGTLFAVITAELMDSAAERLLAVVLVLLSALLQLVWSRYVHRHTQAHETQAHETQAPETRALETRAPETQEPAARQPREAGEAHRAGEYGRTREGGRTPSVAAPPSPRGAATYYWLRSALAFALTWLNPFFGLYAAIGYFDVGYLVRRFRAQQLGLLFAAVTIAGSQSSGLPPRDATHWVVFAGLFSVNALLVLLLSHFAGREAQRDEARATTIAQLERANARLERALTENSGLHAQLLLQAREAGIADERGRLAAEIHDTLAQGLTGIVTQLQATIDAPDPATAATHTSRALDLARESLGEARRSVHGLGPAALEHDELPCALRKTVEEWAGTHRVRAEFTVTGEVEPLHEEVAATLLRIAQEALANTARHAAASRVGVTLSYMDDEVTLDVRDDGRGFDPHPPAPAPDSPVPAAASRRGFGLGGMAARAERVAGTLEVESEPGQGTALSARLPLVRHV